MRAILVKGGKGPSSSLYLSDKVPIPNISQGEVLVRVKAFALNRMDILQRNGHYPLPEGASEILGVEFSGTISQLPADGNTSNQFQIGDRVYGLVLGGAYAEYVLCREELLFKIPDSFTYEIAASIPEVWLTAVQVVKIVGQLKSCDKFMFHAGASGVGQAAIQIALGEGASKVFCTVGSDLKKKFISSQLLVKGRKQEDLIPINYHTEDFVSVINDVTSSKGVDLIVDPIGQCYFNKNLEALAPGGCLVNMGTMSGSIVENANIGKILYKRLRVEGTTLRARSLEYKMALKTVFEHDVLPRIVANEYKHLIDKVFDWEDIVAAHDYMESNQSMGKVVIRVTENKLCRP
jgi:putative PIG3 family NAD(P)H quinone oxidoreductase